jgi:lysophospholipase L1-like esterase
MRVDGILRLVALVLLLAIVGCSRELPLPPLAEDAVILALGDSLTYGTGAAPQQSYPAQLERLSGRRVINAGVPGEMTAAGLERLPEVLDRYRPQLLILCLGGNDLLRKQAPAGIAHNLERMVLLSRERGVPVLLLGVPRPALFGLESEPLYHALAERVLVALEADVIPEVLADNGLKADPIHPNADGYRAIAVAIHARLKRSGAL